MDIEKLFDEFVNECKETQQICGQGEFRANILLIGQEPYRKHEMEGEELKNHLSKNYSECRNHSCCYTHESKDLSPTWKNYQKLIDLIYPDKPKNKGVIDFEKYAFTTELNSVPRPHKKLDSQTKNNIKDRLALFKKSKFIQSFPVIILACGGYIKNIGEGTDRQIDNTFGVEFDEEPNGRYKSKQGKLWFTKHHSKSDERKLVIHTWQFSLGHITREEKEWFMSEMATIIKEHLDHLKNLGLI